MSNNGSNGASQVLTLSDKASAQLARLMHEAGGDASKVVSVLMTKKPKAPRKKPFAYARARGLVRKDKPSDGITYLQTIFDATRYATPGAALRKELLGDDTRAPLPSKEITDGEDVTGISTGDYINPPYDLSALATMLTVNVMHNACIEAKARDIVGNGYELVPSSAALDMGESLWMEWRAQAEHFLSTCTYSRMVKGAPIDVALHALATDYLALGCCGFECLRAQSGLLTGINHIPFSTVKVMREEYERKYKIRFTQQKGQTKNGFIPFGDKVTYPASFDPVTAEAKAFPANAEQRASIVSWSDALPNPRVPTSKESDPTKSATEFYMMARPPFVASQVYGTPSGLTAIAYIIAQIEIDKYNIQFFSSKGVPQYACILEGLEPPSKDTIETDSDEEPSDPYTELETEINEFFTEKLVSAERSIMLLTTFGAAKARFQKLSDDKAEAAFGEYEKRAQEMIRLSHGVPGAAIGLLETANLGSGRDSIQMRRYYSHAILPEQRAFEAMLNYILRVGTLNPWVEVKFKPVDFEDRDARNKLNLERFKEGAFSLDDYLEAEGFEPVGEEEGGNLRVIRTGSVTILNQNPDQAAATVAKLAAKQANAVGKLGQVLAEYMGDTDDTPEEGSDAD